MTESAARSAAVSVSVATLAEVTALSRMLPVATASEPLVEERSALAIVAVEDLPGRDGVVRDLGGGHGVRLNGAGVDRVVRELRGLHGDCPEVRGRERVVGHVAAGAAHNCAVRQLGPGDRVRGQVRGGERVVGHVAAGASGNRAVRELGAGDRVRGEVRGGERVVGHVAAGASGNRAVRRARSFRWRPPRCRRP